MTRKAVIDICQENQMSILEKDFNIEEVCSANEAFVTGTFAGLIPAVEIDGQVISNGERGNFTFRLQKLYNAKLNLLYPHRAKND